MSAGPSLTEAARLHDAGQFDAARCAYRSLLDAQPGSARVLYLLGLRARDVRAFLKGE